MGKIDQIQSGTDVTITLNGDTANISAGGSGQGGDLILKNGTSVERIQIAGQTGSLTIRSQASVSVFIVKGDSGQVTLQGVNAPGHALPRITLDPATATVTVGGNSQSGDIVLKDTNGKDKIRVDAEQQDLLMIGPNGEKRLEIGIDHGKFANILAGGNNAHGRLMLYPKSGNIPEGASANIVLSAESATVIAGGGNQSGDLVLRDTNGKDKIRIDAEQQDLLMVGPNGEKRLEIGIDHGKFANLLAGGNNAHGRIMLYPKSGDIPDGSTANIILSAETGDILLQNADCAEEFDVCDGRDMDPGTVVVISSASRLQQSTKAYDTKVAGVISGARDSRPGIVLGSRDSQEGSRPIALAGRVYCKVDAQYAAVDVGDLLTTSPTPGHAMKAVDPARSFGAVIGKALHPLSSGANLIPVLIALQ